VKLSSVVEDIQQELQRMPRAEAHAEIQASDKPARSQRGLEGKKTFVSDTLGSSPR